MSFLTREQAQAYDRLAMDEFGIPGIVLMENAARGIAELLLTRWGARSGHISIVCGPGSNGGDAFAAARHLANAGKEVRLHLLVPPEAYRDGSDAATNLAVVRAMGLPLASEADLAGAGVILDGIFGTGLVRDVRDPYRSAIIAVNARGSSGVPIMSIDVPSGLDANSGLVLGVAVVAAMTATVVAPKQGFLREAGPAHVGEVVAVDLGAPRSLLERVLALDPRNAS